MGVTPKFMTYKHHRDLINGVKFHVGNCGVQIKVFALNIERAEGTKNLKLMVWNLTWLEPNTLKLMEWSLTWLKPNGASDAWLSRIQRPEIHGVGGDLAICQ